MADLFKLVDHVFMATRTFFVKEVPDLLVLSAEALRKAPFPTSIAAAQKLNRDQIFQLAPTLCALLYATSLPFCWVYNERHHTKPQDRRKNSYWLTRVAVIRGVALCYLAAFSTSAFQARGLFGSLGLQPVHYSPKGRPAPVNPSRASAVQNCHGSSSSLLLTATLMTRAPLEIPQAFWLLMDTHGGLGIPYDDWMLELVSWTGVFLSLLMLTSTITTGMFRCSCYSCGMPCITLTQCAVLPALLPTLLWLLYLSIVNLGGWVINYGWVASPLLACYVMSDTDVGYAAT
eukprot:3932876-Rhodomonas_salina.2